MRNSVLKFDREEVIARARGYFQRASGMNTINPAHIAMLTEGEKVLLESRETISISAVVSSFEQWPAAKTVEDRFSLQGQELALGKAMVHCQAFEQISQEDIRRVYVYFLTIGEVMTGSERSVDQLFADTWGTALVDSARDTLRHMILREVEKEELDGLQLSESFGPGCFGMELFELRNFLRVADGGKIGVTLSGSGGMQPAKSCGGLFFLAGKDVRLPRMECRYCIGNSQGCYYCRNRALQEDE